MATGLLLALFACGEGQPLPATNVEGRGPEDGGPDALAGDAGSVPGPAVDAGCGPGTKSCGERCVPYFDPLFGCAPTTCTPCPTPTGRVASCKAAECASRCKNGSLTCEAVTALSAGASHTCAIGETGNIKCWGHNAYGELGDSSSGSPIPIPVGGVTGATRVAAGGLFSCAATSTGGATCWGANLSGQLGNGGTTSGPTAVAVSSLAAVTEIVTGDAHACALTTGGGVKCWGAGDSGQLGQGGSAGSAVPVEATGLGSGVSAIALGGYHTCALTTAGVVKCWGANDAGQIGDSSTTNRPAPFEVPGLGAGVKAIGAGSRHTCAVTSAGAVKCWGSNQYGELGNGAQSITATSAPVDVVGIRAPATAVTMGYGFTCALSATGTVECWGLNMRGQLGNGTTTASVSPVVVTGLAGAIKLSSGQSHSCALVDGVALCWGANINGELGNGTHSDAPLFVRVSF